MKRIVFVNPLSSGLTSLNGGSVSTATRLGVPLGIVYLFAALRKEIPNEEILHLDFNLHQEHFLALKTKEEFSALIRELLSELSDRPPDVFCVSLGFTVVHSFFVLVSEAIRELFPKSIICCGGAHATAVARHLLEEDGVADYVLCGEGEETLPKLVELLLSGRSADTLPGVHSKKCIRRDASGNIECAPVSSDIDLDFTIYESCLDMAEYVHESVELPSFRQILAKTGNRDEAKSFSIMASRGCPGSCSYCSVAVLHGRRPRWRSMENIRDEILWLKEAHGVRKISLHDANFVPKHKMLELLALLKDLSKQGIEFSVSTMSVHFTCNEIIDAMVDAGMVILPLAIESGVSQTLRKINKHVDLDKAKRLCEYAHSRNMLIKGFFMIGFPGETPPEIRQTLDFAYSLDMDWITVSTATPLPGTRMFEQFAELGYVDDSPAYWDTALFSTRGFETPEIGAEQLSEMSFRAVLYNNYINSRVIRLGMWKEAEVLFLGVTDAIKTQIFGFDALRRIYRGMGNTEKEQSIMKHMTTLLQTNHSVQEYRRYFDMLEPDVREALVEAGRA